jgi:hypothetical protein
MGVHMPDTTHDPDPDNAAEESAPTLGPRVPHNEQGAGDVAPSASTQGGSDDVTILAKVNDDPQSPDDARGAVEEQVDDVTVLARVNDKSPHERDRRG